MTFARGAQALEPLHFSGPLWEELTGIRVEILQLPYPDLYSKPILEHIARSGVSCSISNLRGHRRLPMEASSRPIDSFIDRFMNEADLDDYHPLYKALPTYRGKNWGLFDDADDFALYYRKDIFSDEKLKTSYEQSFAAPFQVPRTWEEYVRVARFISEALAPDIYGAAHFRKAGAPGNQHDFLQQFRANGGVLFDKSMRSQLASAAGLKTLESMLAANAASMPWQRRT